MAILLEKNTTILVQGITGREGSVRAAFMKGYGTKVVAGVTPGRGGEEVSGIPVFNTVEEAVKAKGPVDASVTFVPGPGLKEAVLEALDAGIKFIVMPVERVPLYDILEMMAYGKQKGARLLGPGSIGIISPGIAAAGWLGGTPEFAKRVFVPGPVGVISRSGGQSGTVPWAIQQAGLGVTTVLHIGTEPAPCSQAVAVKMSVGTKNPGIFPGIIGWPVKVSAYIKSRDTFKIYIFDRIPVFHSF